MTDEQAALIAACALLGGAGGDALTTGQVEHVARKMLLLLDDLMWHEGGAKP